MSVAEQLQLLLHYFTDASEQPYSANQLAQMLDLSPQAVLNLLQGHSPNPRLDTVRRVCRFFGITLDYFDLESVQACEAYLRQHVIAGGTPTIQAIRSQSESLTPRAAANVMVLLSWAERAARSSAVEHKRKHE